MKKFFINGYYPKTMESKMFITTDEDKAIAIVDSKVAGGLRYVSILCLTSEEDMRGWEYKGQTLFEGQRCDVYLMLIKGTYND